MNTTIDPTNVLISYLSTHFESPTRFPEKWYPLCATHSAVDPVESMYIYLYYYYSHNY
jgi:hypothetical protein